VIVVSRTIADGDLINGVMNPDAESKTLENDSSEDGILRKKISWARNANTYSTLLKFANSLPRYSAQNVMQLNI